MALAKRIVLFTLTNLLVLVTITITLNILSAFFGVPLHPGTFLGLILFCAMWGMGGAFISLMLSKTMAKYTMGLKYIDPQTRDPQAREIVDMVHSIARQAKLPKMPDVAIYDSPEVNAFATGPSRSNSLVAVSTGLLRRMSKDEVEGVIGHEVAHIANGDMVTLTLIQGVVNAFVLFFARLLAGVISSMVDERMRFMVHIGLIILFDILFAILGMVVVRYFSRQREFRADLGGARYTSREKMLSALKRLQANYDPEQKEPEGQEGAIATMKISNKSKMGIKALLSTHPPLEVRIRRLERASIS